MTVTVNGLGSPLLYISPQQINFQVPFEIANASEATLVFTSSSTPAESNTLAVTSRNPAAFLDTVTSHSSVDFFHCPVSNGGVYSGGPLPIAFNSDGSRNTCTNPASPGSVITFFLQGLGVTSPAPVTGAVNSTSVALNLPIVFTLPSDIQLISATTEPGQISSVWKIEISIPADDLGAAGLNFTVGGIAMRDTNLTFWVQ